MQKVPWMEKIMAIIVPTPQERHEALRIACARYAVGGDIPNKPQGRGHGQEAAEGAYNPVAYTVRRIRLGDSLDGKTRAGAVFIIRQPRPVARRFRAVVRVCALDHSLRGVSKQAETPPASLESVAASHSPT
eukprot:scaffold2475_cov245-Pinguiococcus_pyrenoidosus.AAC.3